MQRLPTKSNSAPGESRVVLDVPDMLKLAAFVMVLLVAGTALADEPFTSTEGKFSITLPKKPDLSTQPLVVGTTHLTMHLATIEFADSAILVSFLDYLDDGGMTAVQRITATVDAEVKGQKGTVIGKVSNCDTKKFLCREVAYKQHLDAMDLVKTMRNYLVGRRLYQVALMTTTTGTKPDLVKSLFDSFKIN